MEYSVSFEKGSLLRFSPFYFPDGGKPKDKYFIVLHIEKDQLLLASLPTSKDHVPADVPLMGGCIDLPERNFNAFVFLGGNNVTESFAFPLNTFIYGTDLHEYAVRSIINTIVEGNTKIISLGKILPDIFENLKNCLRNSKAVRHRFKAMLCSKADT